MESANTYRLGLGSTQPPFQRKPRFPSDVNEARECRWPLTSI